MTTVDIAICVYGKPFQTAVTLATLLHHSEQHIGTVFIQEEKEQPHGEVVSFLPWCFPETSFAVHRPEMHHGVKFTERRRLPEAGYRRSIRYQAAWEDSSAGHLFITHNDVLYLKDVIGLMLDHMEGDTFSGVGRVGQCWNCPASYAGRCSGETHEDFRPTYEEVETLLQEHRGVRTHISSVTPEHPYPLPECRLNEFAALINLRKTRPDVFPVGPVIPIGCMTTDTGTTWFRDLRIKGHRFRHLNEGFKHGPFSATTSGNLANSDASRYEQEEDRAKQYLLRHFPKVYHRAAALHRFAKGVRG
jgi:hypothetical protein